MRVRRLKRKLYRDIAWMLATVCLFTSVENLGGSFFTVQAKEETALKYNEDVEKSKYSLSMGYDHSAVIKSDGSLWMWGSNKEGGLGIENESIESSNNPIRIMDNVKFVSMGGWSQSSAAIKSDDSLWMWGNINLYNNDKILWKPKKIMDNVRFVSNDGRLAIIKADDSLWVKSGGYTGYGEFSDENGLSKIMDDVKAVSSNAEHCAAIKNDGSLWMWGKNNYGQLGDGTKDNNLKPIKIMENVKMAAVGFNHSAAIKNDGSLWTWGNNQYGQLGDGTTNGNITPTKIMDNVKMISLGESHSAAIKEDDSLWIWGRSTLCGFGDDWSAKNEPTKLMDGIYNISLGYDHSAAIKNDGSLWIWGKNRYGQLGIGNSFEEQEIALSPTQIMPAGSISVSSTSGPKFNMNIETQDKPRIRVMDEKKYPIEGARVTHLGKEVETMEDGYAFLQDYKEGEPISVSKEGYHTLETSFHKFKSGCTPYVLSSNISSITFTSDGEDFDLLTQEVVINRYDKKSFSIKYLSGGEKYETYMIYSGEKFVASSPDGVFKELRSDMFLEGKPVYLKLTKQTADSRNNIKKLLGIRVVDVNPNIGSLSFGEGISLSIPEDVPVIGGQNFELNLDAVPIKGEISTDGKIQLGIGFDKDWDKDLFEKVKNLDEDNCEKLMSELEDSDEENSSNKGGSIGADIKVIGYLEGGLISQGRVTGKAFVELSAAGSLEQQCQLWIVPVVVEVSLEGSINANGSITLTMAGEWMDGALSAGGELALGLYGGIGITKLSGGIYGQVGAGLNYIFFPEDENGLDEFYVEGQAGLKGKAFGKEATWEMIDGKYIIFPENKRGFAKSFAIDNDKVYAQLDRSYLTAEGTMSDWTPDEQINADGNLRETTLQDAACLDMIPKVVRMGDTIILFYLTDAGAGRDSADRSMLVYSLWDQSKENWSEPKAVLDDGTADFAPDLYSDGEKIYAVWQNGTESLKGDLTLNEIAERLVLHTAVYDSRQDQFVNLGSIESENGLFQQNPQIMADENGVSVYWYENREDNVLGISGTNRIYQAVLQDVEGAADLMAVQGVEEIEEPEEEESAEEDDEQGETETEISDVNEEAEDASKEDDRAEEGETEDNAEEDLPEDISDQENEETVSENSVGENTFKTFVALTEEEPKLEESDSENEDTEEENPMEPEIETNKPSAETTNPEEPKEGKEESEKSGLEKTDTEKEEPIESETKEESEQPEESTPDNTVSENTISENTVETMAFDRENKVKGPWTVRFLQEEKDCIVSADAGKTYGKSGYAYGAGPLDGQYNMSSGRVIFLSQEGKAVEIGSGEEGNVVFAPVFGGETLTWYQKGNIYYMNEAGKETALFEESRLPSSTYTLLSDGAGRPEVIFPVNRDGKSNLYRISYENGVFLSSIQVTDQEDYIQYADGFVDGGKTVLVYNKMKVNDALEEEQNSLCTGMLVHSYYDIALSNAGSTIRFDEKIGENVLEITAQLYNNGTVKAENLSLTISKADGSVLGNIPIDAVLEPGETKYATAVFSTEMITEEADYTVSVSGGDDSNENNNSAQIRLGEASLRVNAKMLSVSDKRILQAGIENTGVTACGGTIYVRDKNTGKTYADSVFEPITAGQTVFIEMEIDPAVFADQDLLSIEVAVLPDGKETEVDRDFVSAYAPVYTVNFVTDAEQSSIYARYGESAEFPNNPTKEGACFIGWYTAKDPSAGKLYTEETPIKEDVTLYACFGQTQSTISMENCSVTPIPAQFYTGKALKPAVTVKWGSEILRNNKDYTASYQNNINQGRASVTITGKGKYTGSISRSFSIYYPISKVSVKAIPAVNFSGENHTPEVTVTYQKKNLVKNTDYTVSYFNNRNAGTAGVTITGKGKYSGQKTVTFQIKGTAISGMKFDKIPDVVYNGRNTRPIVTVRTKDGKTQLMSGSDYRLVYENTVNKGTAAVTVIGNGNYTGTKKLTYKVAAKPLAESMVSVEQPSLASLAAAPEKAVYIYTGKPIKPVLTVTDQAAGGVSLVLNRDYTVSYSKNKAVGEAQIMVKGKGNYSGTVKIPFTISPLDLAKAQTEGKISIRVNDMAYTGKALKPAVQIYETVDGKEKKIPAGSYTLSYTNNVKKGTGTVTITGKEKSGCTGTVTADFKIIDKAKLISSSTVKIDAIPSQTFTGAALEPVLCIVDKSDKTKEITLEQGTHYEISYKNNVNAGKATVTVKGIGSYAGSKNMTFKINKRAIADKNVLGQGFTIEQMPDLKYTGYAQKPDVIIKDKGSGIEKQLVQGQDYKLSYRKNTNIGTATVTIKGMGNYNGSINTATFQIVGWDYNTLAAEVSNQVYTGKALKPQITFYMTGEKGREDILLKPNTAVKILYKNNKDVGTATVTVIGKGELKNIEPLTVSFGIEPADLSEAVVARIANQKLKGVPATPIPKVKVGRNSLKAGRDFKVSYLRNGVRGEATVIITGIGNYTGECRKTFIVQ